MSSRSLTSLIVSSLFLLLEVSAGKNCLETCAASANEPTEHCDCCYESLHEYIESYTSRNWTNITKFDKRFDEERIKWALQRQPNDPIVGVNTMIAACLYTFTRNTLKLTAIFPPLHPDESRSAELLLTGLSSGGIRTSSCTIAENTWHCLFRVEDLEPTETYTYRVSYRPDAVSDPYIYEGLVPIPQGYPNIASLGCFGPDDTSDKTALVDSVLQTKPDILVLSGDQTYLHENLGYGFLETMFTIRDITRNIPTIVQLDDHDYGMGNIWGAGEGGEDDSGSGFAKRPCLVNSLQQLTMGHLPDPATADTLDSGVTIHYTNYEYGEVDFAIIEARKFKHMKGGDSLLGKDQEKWLESWCSTNTEAYKVVLTQTPFGDLSTHVTAWFQGKGISETLEGSKDTNGYPPTGRNRFMKIIKGCSNLILAGDQHLAVAVEYDVDEGHTVLECSSPAVVNDVFWRMNVNKIGEMYTDHWGHPYRLLNTWNVHKSLWDEYGLPRDSRAASDAVKRKRADGFLAVRWDDKDSRSAICEMYSYRERHEMKWKVKASTSANPIVIKGELRSESKMVKNPNKLRTGASCHRRCSGGSDGDRHSTTTRKTCMSDVACKGCDPSEVCPNLCSSCSSTSAATTGSISMSGDVVIQGYYGGLACECRGA